MENQIKQIKQWFELAVPEPTLQNQNVQLGVHFEEVGEMITAAGFPKDYVDSITELSYFLKTYHKHLWCLFENQTANDVDLLDSLCDQIVTAVGVAHMFGYNIEGALQEVIRSNNSKFVDGKPVFDANGKIAKPPTYSKPDLIPYV